MRKFVTVKQDRKEVITVQSYRKSELTIIGEAVTLIHGSKMGTTEPSSSAQQQRPDAELDD